MGKRKLSQKEEKFCQLYSVLGHLQEAAIGAGFPVSDALEQSAALLSKDEVQNRCRQLVADRQGDAIIGLRRLAFSPINDVVRLITAEEPPTSDELALLDLFCVSKIKQNKDGRLEVELYDRFKVLQALLDQEDAKTEGTSIYDAIHRSAAAMREPSDVTEVS